MEIKITGTPEEIEKLLNAIGGSKEQFNLEDKEFLINKLKLAAEALKNVNDESRYIINTIYSDLKKVFDQLDQNLNQT